MPTVSPHWNAAALPAAVTEEVESSIQSPCPKLWSEGAHDQTAQSASQDLPTLDGFGEAALEELGECDPLLQPHVN